MDIEKLIEQLEAWNEQHLSVVCGNGHFACDYLCENEDCIVVRVVAALSMLQAENEKLRWKIEDARLEGYAKGLGEMSEENEKLRGYINELETQHRTEMCENGYDCVELGKLRAELEQVKAERDAAIGCIYKIEDALDRGNDNDWAREHILEWESKKEG